jgi:hypothetical protein
VGVTKGISVVITAWDEAYYPGGVEVIAPQAGVTITLIPHLIGDDTDHEWYTPNPCLAANQKSAPARSRAECNRPRPTLESHHCG